MGSWGGTVVWPEHPESGSRRQKSTPGKNSGTAQRGHASGAHLLSRHFPGLCVYF